ncbi:MAG: hypothetical protein GWO20_20890, partial [Candidatus Korarchaeota archaeon]|nr:hypothetical protein [Candidatus Korarchaeota archaeon]NIU85673.1 hypothetical protein [Candidatus Thorarchaeota archaeon]NIW15773.1 hypothetical protein [Candidatus Thorarchaeota archaeon]NIW53687.1 hypothetical protein [Candidatus Korarchaeota archaeon]
MRTFSQNESMHPSKQPNLQQNIPPQFQNRVKQVQKRESAVSLPNNSTTQQQGKRPAPSFNGDQLHILADFPPDVYINNPTNTTYPRSQVNINVTVEFKDGKPAKNVIAEVNNTENVTLVNTTNAISINTSFYKQIWFNDTYHFVDGTNTITVYAENRDGVDKKTVTFSVDTSPPQVIIHTPANNSTVSGDMSIQVYWNDLDPNRAYIIDNGTLRNESSTIGNHTYTWDTTHLIDGLHNITFLANDTEGHVNRTFTWIYIDNTAPNVTIVSPLHISYSPHRLDINVTAIDSLTSVDMVLAEVNGTENMTLVLDEGGLYYNDTYLFTEGINTIRIYANDTQGNGNTTQTITFTVGIPMVRITIPSNGSVLYGSIEIELYWNDHHPNTSILYLNGMEYNVSTNDGWRTLTWNTTDYVDGIYNLTFWANDSYAQT